MKRLLTLSCVLAATLAANAQDTSQWKNGDDVTEQLQWKATVADDENIDDPYWKGFQYGQDAPSTWEFRDGSGGERDDYHSWGVYNVSTWNVYQEFEIPAGVYTLKMAGAYREGTTNITFDKWLAGDKTTKAFMYVKVGEETFETPLMYMFAGEQKEALFPYDGWQNDCSFPNKKGELIYGPSCHWGADLYLERGNWNWNELLFIVPETSVIRIGIDKRVDQPQDQVWWNEWRMIYEMPYDENISKSLVAYGELEDMLESAEGFINNNVVDSYGSLSSIMFDELFDFNEKYDNISKTSPYEDIKAAIDELKQIDANNREAFTKTQTMEVVIGVCDGIVKVTDFAGKEEFQAAIDRAKSVLYDAETLDYTVADYLDAADKLNKARIDYLLTQDKGADASYDFTHAISFPWFVNQEYTPTFNGSVYVFPDEVESTWFGSNAPDDETDLERETTDKAGNTLTPIADKAHWSTSETAEEQWVYQDKWAGWHGGMKNCIQKLKGYAAFYSGWASGANANGGMWVTQVLNDLPEGLYTLEGYVFIADDGFATDGNQYMFMNDAEGNELLKVKNEKSLGFWSFWGRDGWIQLKSDFFYVPGGKVTVGYHHNSMAGNAGMTLKYFGTELDYSLLLQNKINENAPEELDLWPADLATYNAMIAQVQFPIVDMEAYAVANKQVDDAIAFKKTAANAVASFTLPTQYGDLMNNYPDDDDINAILSVAWENVIVMGDGENDSYTDIAPAVAIYNAYASYVYKFAEAKTYDSEKINNLVAEQATYLKNNYASVETLAEYERALATPINEAIFDEKGAASATEANPMEITDMLANPSFAEGPKTGWTCEGEDVNPAINTYGRELAECWNQKPFTISQTLRSLPAGVYELRVRACYRDATAVDAAMVERAKNGEGQNAYLFASTQTDEVSTPVISTAAGEWTEPSFTVWYNAKQVADEVTVYGFVKDWDNTVCILEDEIEPLFAQITDDDLKLYITEGKQEMDVEKAGEQYPFDTKVGSYFYPSSMAGFKARITSTPDAYVNVVRVLVQEGEDLTVGLKKIDAVASDWLIYDDFQLFYLGTDIPTAISEVNAAKANNPVIYNLAGQRVTKSYKGIVIENGVKKYNK